MDDCGLIDLGFTGAKFTWCNKQDAQSNVKVRLDRAAANGEFSHLFDDYCVENVNTTTSDHYALLILLSGRANRGTGAPIQQSFRFEAAWLRAEDYRGFVENAWVEGRIDSPPLQAAWSNLQRMADSLRRWSKLSFGNVRKNIQKLERRLSSLHTLHPNDNSVEEEKLIEKQLCELFEREEVIEREEVMARQRSRVDGLKEGDHNTAFFHARASARQRTNKIRMLSREDGSLCEDLEGMKGMAERFYADLFASECCNSMEEVLESIPRKVDDFINEELCKPYSNSEIKMALFQMGPTKAPGPDGFPALFYQTHWEFIEEEICSAVRSFLTGDLIPEGLCDSVIILIPKVNNATHLSKFRPISLCNVLYKIASKVPSNRLKPFLPGVVSEFQSAFVPGRLITGSALVAYECLHSIKKQQCKKPFFAPKVDMMKAYDRVEWSFLHGCLLKLGFADPWIQTIMRCVTSVRYAVRINGELTYPVTPSRGLRQGDPISPYLFLLCTEGLSSILQKKESMGVIQGIRNGRLGPPISHLLFEDDSIFFARSDLHSVQGLKDALQAYCKASGQKINLQKSSIFFGQNCPEEIKNSVKETLQVSVEILQDTYLGMPTEIGRASIGSFLFLPERVWRRVNGWNDRPMSRAGKETMLKAVAQAIPTYVMSCFKLPVTTCEKMKSCILDHWWGFEDGKKKMHWRS